MQKTSLLIMLILILSGMYLLQEKQEEIIYADEEAPIINVIENDLTFYESDEFDYFDYVEVSDNSNKYSLKIVNEEESKLPGEKVITIEAIDEAGNKTREYINVNIIADTEWRDYIINNTYNYLYRSRDNDNLVDIKGYADKDAFHLAENFIGMRGSCNEVAQAFIDAYFGEGFDVLLGTYPITLEEAKPGDIIYYANGGIGQQHYATYLGGFSALQGNINGTTFIGSVYMNKGSAPQFRRLIGVE